MKKLWGGRFKEKTAASVEKFTESVSYDCRLALFDIEGSLAHAEMLGRQAIIPKADADKIVKGLTVIRKEIESGKFRFDPALEDVHMNIESALTARIGPVGGKLHTARSRNDQVATDIRLYLRHEIAQIDALLRDLQLALIGQAERHVDVIMPGYTHMQRAQPVSLAHHLLAYVEMFARDRDRLSDAGRRVNVLPLGACALAGTTLPIDRKSVAKKLGFRAICENSIDAVSDRDFSLEFLSASSIVMMHLSRISEELVLWSSTEFGFITLPDAFTTGSSIMPQKKNPDVPELIRGKTGRVYGNMMNLFTIMKGLPLAYNRDMQEDKPPLFDTVDTVKASLDVLARMIARTEFHAGRLTDAASGGFSTATDIAEYLVRQGMPFRQAHEVTGKVVAYCIERKCELTGMTIAEYRKFSNLIKPDLLKLLSANRSANARRSAGGTSPVEVRKRLRALKLYLSK